MAKKKPLVMTSAATCPNRESHTEGPRDYCGWHAWAERMGKTHKQSRCPLCNLWVIWTPKEKK